MSLRVCSEPNCPVLIPKQGRCPDCAREQDKARGSRQARGYDAAHEQERKRWKRILDRQPWPCARCGEVIPVGTAWDLGHDDLDRTKYHGPEHQACNRATASR